MMILFVATYAIRTKPCAYCAVIILGLMFSTCSLFSFQNHPTIETENSSQPSDHQYISSCWIGLSNGLISNQTNLQHQNDPRIPTLGWWSAPTRRKSQTHLRSWWEKRARQDVKPFSNNKSNNFRSVNSNLSPTLRDRIQTVWHDGLHIGFPDSGFKIRLFID